MRISTWGTRGAALAAIAASALFASTTSAATVFALTDENDLVSFDSASPSDVISGGPISGLGSQDLIGIDFRPANGLLYGVGNLGGVFQIDTTTRAATLVSTLTADAGDTTAPFTGLSGTRYGVDFNPVPDRLRVVSDTEQNLRINVGTGATITDGALQYGINQPGATGDDPNVAGAAYTNSFPGATTTTLYTIDVRGSEDRLVIQSPPNDGTLTVVGPLGVNASALLGFDIFFDGQTNVGFASLLVPGNFSQLFAINLSTGQATLIGEINGGDTFDGLAVAPIPEPASLGLAAAAAAGVLLRRGRR